MARGHVPKREPKKRKKKEEKPVLVSLPALTSPEVEATGKRRKAKKEEL